MDLHEPPREEPSEAAEADGHAPGEPAADLEQPPADAIEDAPPPVAEARWTGASLQAYEVGDPGRAAREVVPTVSENPIDPVDTQLDGATAGPLVVRAASSRGTSHRHSGTPRQDDYAICVCADSWLVVAVADGVSAGELSHQAATLACRSAAALVRDSLASDSDADQVPWLEILSEIARRIVGHGRRTLTADASDEDVTPEMVARAMATTLVVLVLAVEPDEAGVHAGRVLALGDTSVFQLSGESDWHAITKIKNEGAEIASSATLALPYLPAQEIEPTAVALSEGEALFVMTDGVGDPLGRGDGPVGDFLSTMWRTPPEMLSFAAQVGFARRSFDDDRTVVGVWAGPP